MLESMFLYPSNSRIAPANGTQWNYCYVFLRLDHGLLSTSAWLSWDAGSHGMLALGTQPTCEEAQTTLCGETGAVFGSPPGCQYPLSSIRWEWRGSGEFCMILCPIRQVIPNFGTSRVPRNYTIMKQRYSLPSYIGTAKINTVTSLSLGMVC